MLSQFNTHCRLFNLLPSYQSAYREHDSCETSLIKLVNRSLWNMECQRVNSIFVMDLLAAFDLINFNILLAVLRDQYGMQDNTLKWFDSYLHPRGYRVKINDSWSEYKELHQSVPQRSCSGPQLYSVFASTMQYVPIWDVNGNEGNNIALCDAKSDIDLNGFADDHSINKDVREEEYVTLVKMEKPM